MLSLNIFLKSEGSWTKNPASFFFFYCNEYERFEKNVLWKMPKVSALHAKNN